MRRLLTIALLLLASPAMLMAQKDDLTVFPVDENDPTPPSDKRLAHLDDLVSRIFFPWELGMNIPMANGLKSGFTGKTAVEWRLHHLNGIFASFLYNVREFDYSGILPEGSNLRSGTMWYNDLMLGPGWRWQLGHTPLCLATQLSGGVTICRYGTIQPDGDGTTFETVSRHCVLPSARANLFWEFYLAQSFAIYLSAAYTQHLKVSPFTTSLGKEGCIELCVGINTTLW